MILVEIVGAVNDVGTLKTFYISDSAFVTKPTDTPANVAFDPTLSDLVTETSVFADSQTTGSSKSEGRFEFSNSTGLYDEWLSYSFEGRNVIVRKGEESGAYPADFAIISSGIVQSITVTTQRVSVTLRDRQAVFEKPVVTNVYKGDNVLPNGVEGTNDIKGKVKPLVLGSVFNITPILVNTSKLTYQVNDGAISQIVVKDKGVVLTLLTDYADVASLQAATIPSNRYATCLAQGYFRLGSIPSGKVTADVVQTNNAGERTAPYIVNSLAVKAGAISIDSNSLEQTKSNNSANVGIFINSEESYASSMDEVANSIGMFYAHDPSGRLVYGILTIPVGQPDFTFGEYEILKGIERKPAKDNNTGAYAARLNYLKNYSPSGNDLAGSIGAAESAFLSIEYRSQYVEDQSVKLKFLTADVIEKDTLLTEANDALNEANRLLQIYKYRRDIFTVPIHFDSLPATPLYLMAKVSLDYSRFGVQSRLFRLLGIAYDMQSKRATLTLWG